VDEVAGRNQSQVAIYDITVWLVRQALVEIVSKHPVIPPTDQRKFTVTPHMIGSLLVDVDTVLAVRLGQHDSGHSGLVIRRRR